MDFLGVEKNDPRREQEGIYTSSIFKLETTTIKVIVLDTRYFRSPLKKAIWKVENMSLMKMEKVPY
ncbi:hypothetical protein AB832_00655 [Flavobacteriaceae bacterium (ex Bugula neritina AB1)]|nr:hypothetical protein AB832_00655 [Flavobacteriaceae bacterium (ex Bugula neritina AB1)]